MTYDDFEEIVHAICIYRNRGGFMTTERYEELIKSLTAAVGLHSDLSQMVKRYGL